MGCLGTTTVYAEAVVASPALQRRLQLEPKGGVSSCDGVLFST